MPGWKCMPRSTPARRARVVVLDAWLLRYISTHDFLPFVIYRIALAVVVAVLLITGVLEPLPSPEPLGGN